MRGMVEGKVDSLGVIKEHPMGSTMMQGAFKVGTSSI